MSGVIVAAYLIPMPPKEGFADVEGYRTVFFHVPMAITATVAFLVATFQAGVYLWRRDLRADDHSATAAELGLLFAFLATATGSIFSGTQWGLYWNWDPRQTAIVILMLLYGAYLGLRAAVEDEEARARLSAAYAVFAFFPMLFLMFLTRPEVANLLERLGLELQTLHPRRAPLEAMQKMVLMAAMFGFFGVYAWLHRLRVATLRLHRRLREGANLAR
jgi:heme exporter protein C